MTEASRRDVLRLGVGLAVATGLVGCTPSDPTVDQPSAGSTSSSSPSSSPSSGRSSSASASTGPATSPTLTVAQRGSEAEIRLGNQARAILGGRRKTLSKGQRALLTGVVATHQAHASALSSYKPPGPLPVVKGSTRDVLTQLARAERAAARRYRRTALESSGTEALRWASLSLAAAGFSSAATDATPPRVTKLRSPKPVALLSDTAATQELVRQLHAVIYGYQLAIGTFKVASAEHDRAVRELLAQRVRRDRLIAWLVRRKADVPAAAPAYVPSVNPSSPRKARQLLMRMHIDLEPFCGLMIAAANDRDRERALDQLSATIATARAWGAPINPWPGYA